MKDEWFRWEREATIHLLFPTLEGSMKSGYPTTILIFKNGIVTWCCLVSELYGLGVKLLEVYKDKKKEQQMAAETAIQPQRPRVERGQAGETERRPEIRRHHRTLARQPGGGLHSPRQGGAAVLGPASPGPGTQLGTYGLVRGSRWERQ